MKAALQLHPTHATEEMLSGLVFPVLHELGCAYYELPRKHEGVVPLESGTDFIIVLGGDGTFLYGARLAAMHGLPILGVMLGRLGYMCSVALSELGSAVAAIIEGTMPVEERHVLRGSVLGAQSPIYEQIAINDVVLFRSGSEKLRDFTARDDGNLIARYRADGIILASATGSTAYTLSAGGPLVHPSLDVIIMTPVCAHSMFTKPLVLPPGHEVEITGAPSSYPMSVSFDGAQRHQLEQGERLVVRGHPASLRVYRPDEHGFYQVLRDRFQHGYYYGADDA